MHQFRDVKSIINQNALETESPSTFYNFYRHHVHPFHLLDEVLSPCVSSVTMLCIYTRVSGRGGLSPSPPFSPFLRGFGILEEMETPTCQVPRYVFVDGGGVEML